MPDITLTITIDEATARELVAIYEEAPDYMCAHRVSLAIAAALPPTPPKEGEVWLEFGHQEWSIGPTWSGRTLVCGALNGRPVTSRDTDYITKHWTKVR